MGFGDFLFGKYKLLPGFEEDIGSLNELRNRNRAYDTGLGKAGKIGKSVLKAFETNRTETNPIIQAYLNTIRNRAAVGNRELGRQAVMGVNATATGQQRNLLNAALNTSRLRNEEQAQIAMGEMMPHIFEQASNVYGRERAQRIAAEQAGMDREADIVRMINEIRQRGTYKTGGALGAIGKIAGFARPLLTGLPAG